MNSVCTRLTQLYLLVQYTCVRRVHTLYISYFIEHNGNDEHHEETPLRPDLLWPTASLPFKAHRGCAPGWKWQGREADHSLHPVPRLRMSGLCLQFSIRIYVVHRDSFNLSIKLSQIKVLCFFPYGGRSLSLSRNRNSTTLNSSY